MIMKMSKLSFIAVLALAGLLAMGMVGQAAQKKAGKAKARASAQSKMTEEERINSMAAKLGLNDDQKTKLKAVFEDESKTIKELRASGGFASLAPQEKRTKLAKIRQDANQKVMTFLTDDQKTKWKELRKENRPKQKRTV
jgi:periplasmic protein CpxP/Spy